MLILLTASIVFSLGAIVLNIMLIINGFKNSIKLGIIAILAPLFLGGGISGFYVIAHKTAIDKIGASEVQAKGDKEFEKQKNDLDNLENLDL